MALFNFLKSKNNEQKVTALQQQIISLQEELHSMGEKKEAFQSQLQELKSQISDKTKDIEYLELEKKTVRNDLDDLQSLYNKLLSLLQTSTTKVKSLRSSTEGQLVDFKSNYLVALDENDFNELSSYYELKAENDSLILKKGECEKELRRVESTTRDLEDKSAKLQHQVVSLQEEVSTEKNTRDELKGQIDELQKQVASQKN